MRKWPAPSCVRSRATSPAASSRSETLTPPARPSRARAAAGAEGRCPAGTGLISTMRRSRSEYADEAVRERHAGPGRSRGASAVTSADRRESYREGSQTVDPVETARGAAERTAARTPVSNTERRQRVIDEIKRRIVLGELRPGERIIEADLTSSLEVSRPTAREALNQMARDGLLIQEAYRGLRVADIEVDSMLEIARVRASPGTEAIDEILDDSTGARMARLEESWERFESESNAADPLAVHEAHIRFHRGIWEAAGNYLLMRIWPVVEAQMTIILA